jgi:antirestriction protein ArdC
MIMMKNNKKLQRSSRGIRLFCSSNQIQIYMGNDKVYEIVSDKILQIIKSTGKLPWVKPWKNGLSGGPANGISKRPYDPFGINFFMLSNAPYSSNFYLTFKQVTDLGGHVKKGEKGWPIVFWKITKFKKTDVEGKEVEKTFPLLRYYTVFNVEQCEGISIEAAKVEVSKNNPIERAEEIIKNYEKGPQIKIKQSDRAFYQPGLDSVTMPELNQFNSAEEFYSTMFHELSHSTGHKNRLNRKEVAEFNGFGSYDYGVEELTAELSAAFLCADARISNETVERNSAAYLNNWMNAIKADDKLFIMAASRAGKAAKHILGIKKEVEE